MDPSRGHLPVKRRPIQRSLNLLKLPNRPYLGRPKSGLGFLTAAPGRRLAPVLIRENNSKGDFTVAVRVRGTTSLIGLIWVVVGVFIAWTHDYITIDLLRRVISALLAIF